MKNGLSKNNTYLEFNEKDVSTKSRNESLVTMKDSIFQFKFYTIYEMAFLMTKIILPQILNKKLFQKIFGFMMRKDNLGIFEEYNENKKIDLLNYQQNSKHLIFYQTKNDLKSLINKPYLIVENSDISTEKCTEYVELLFDSYTNISFISSSNFIELIILGQINDDIFSGNNDINYERTEFKYVFNKILFTLYFDYYSSKYNDGKTIVKISLKINFPENIIYSSYFNLQIGQYINKCLTKNYNGNKIMRDIKNKYDKLIFINESKKKYNICHFFDIIKKTKTKFGKAKKMKNRQEKTKFEEIYNREAKTEFEEINNSQAKTEFEDTNNRTEIIYNSNSENNLVEIDEYKRYHEQIQYNYKFYNENDIISDELSRRIENYTIINDEFSP
jgi:hypothetical protein